MKKLILIRHAKSSWDDSRLKDIERPLNSKGLIDAHKMGAFLKSSLDRFDHVYTSPANRALGTCEIINSEIGYQGDIEIDSSLYTFDHHDVFLRLAQNSNHNYNLIAMFGHNYAIQNAVEKFSTEKIKKFPTCAICIIEWEVDDWSKATYQNYTSSQIIKPSMI